MRRLLLALLLSGVVPAAAHAEVRPGVLQDPAGDAVQGGPDVVSVAVEHDTGGAVTARLTFAAAPPSSSDALAAVVVGARTSSGSCGTLYAFGAGLGSQSPTSRWSTRDGSAGDGTRVLDGATLTIQARDAALGVDADCFSARVSRVGGTALDYDLTDVADLTLPDGDGDGVPDRADDCPTQAAPGQPDGCPPASTTTTTTPPPPPPPPPPPAPVATPLERYDAAAARCASKRKALRARCLATARSRERKGYALARKRRTNPFLGRAFFRPDIDVAGGCGGTCLAGLVFVDDRFAYRGAPDDGPVFVRCTGVTATGDDDGCLRYAVSRDRRTATVAGVRYGLIEGGRQVEPSGDNGGPLTRVAVPAAGERAAVALHSISGFGVPGVSQTFSTSDLTLAADGRFVVASTVSGTSGQGSDFEQSFTSLGPDRRGRYAFEPGGTFALTFDDGRVVRRSAFVAFGPRLQTGRIARDGLFLNGSFYQPPE